MRRACWQWPAWPELLAQECMFLMNQEWSLPTTGLESGVIVTSAQRTRSKAGLVPGATQENGTKDLGKKMPSVFMESQHWGKRTVSDHIKEIGR